jgi:hypothetical protein
MSCPTHRHTCPGLAHHLLLLLLEVAHHSRRPQGVVRRTRLLLPLVARRSCLHKHDSSAVSIPQRDRQCMQKQCENHTYNARVYYAHCRCRNFNATCC